MTQTLSIHLNPTEGFLRRIIGLIEQRGYAVGAINMPMISAGAAEMTISVIPRDDARSVDILSRQIMRLMDVTKVTSVRSHGEPQ